MTDIPADSPVRRIREALADLAALRAEEAKATERFVAMSREALAEARVDRDAAVASSADESEWTRIIDELENRLADTERSAREEAKRLDEEAQELRRAKREFERDTRIARRELEDLKTSRDEEAEEREIARRKLETRLEKVEAENRRMQAELAAARGPVPPPPRAEEANDDDSDDTDDGSEVRRALKALGKKRPG